MLQWLSETDPVFQAFVATVGTYVLTAVGTLPVLFFGSAPRALMDALMLAMTLHNFPEGMAVGVTFGGADFGSAVALAIGIGLQNIPEGLAIALPLRRGGMAPARAFFWGSSPPSNR